MGVKDRFFRILRIKAEMSGFENRFFGLTVLMMLLACFQSEGQNTRDMLDQVRESGVPEMINGKEYLIHTIKKGQTLYMISKAYGVDVNDIIAENPGVKNGIKADQKIRIPIPQKEKPAGRKTKTPPVEPEPQAADTLLPGPESRILPCGTDSSALRNTYNIALMLPLFLDEMADLNLNELPQDPYTAYNPLKFVQFYEGFRMAFDSLTRAGVPVKLFVYDVPRDTSRTREILGDTALLSVHLIVGLLYHRNFTMVAEFAEQHNIPIINPITERTDIVERNPLVIKIHPSSGSRMEEMASFLKRNCSDGQIQIIRNNQYRNRDMPEDLIRLCYAGEVPVLVAEGQSEAIGRLASNRMNYLVAFTDNSMYALELSRRLYELRNDYAITLIGLPEWKQMEGLETEYMVSLHCHLMTPWHIDYSDEGVKRFTRDFQQIYLCDPDILAFKGYDIALYFITALRQYGVSFIRCLDETRVDLLHTRFRFEKTNQGGYENRYWDIIEYNNYRLVRSR